jgi:hypothetical protein
MTTSLQRQQDLRLLELPNDASLTDIEEAYRVLLRRYALTSLPSYGLLRVEDRTRFVQGIRDAYTRLRDEGMTEKASQEAGDGKLRKSISLGGMQQTVSPEEYKKTLSPEEHEKTLSPEEHEKTLSPEEEERLESVEGGGGLGKASLSALSRVMPRLSLASQGALKHQGEAFGGVEPAGAFVLAQGRISLFAEETKRKKVGALEGIGVIPAPSKRGGGEESAKQQTQREGLALREALCFAARKRMPTQGEKKAYTTSSLRALRLKHGMSLMEVRGEEGIQLSLFQALEAGDFQAVPSTMALRLLLRCYAHSLSLSESVLLTDILGAYWHWRMTRGRQA